MPPRHPRRASHAELRHLCNAAPVGLALVDVDRHVLFANSRFAAFMGTTVPACLGASVETLEASARRLLRPVLERVLDAAAPRLVAEELAMPCGPFRLSAFPLCSSHQEVFAVSLVLEPRPAAAAAPSPPGTNGVARSTRPARPAAAGLDRFVAEVERAAVVVNSLRALLAHGRRSETDLTAAVQAVLPLVETEAAHAALAVRFDAEANLAPVLADDLQIQQVVLNLARNAIEATAERGGDAGSLEIQTLAAGAREVEVVVRHAGHDRGAKPAARTLDPFYTTREGGLGLGLSIDRMIVEAHGGRLWATTDPEGGVTLRFTLPACSRVPPA